MILSKSGANFGFLISFPSRSAETILRSMLTTFDHAAARELRLRWTRRDFRLLYGDSAFSFLARWRRHEVDEEVHEIHWRGQSHDDRCRGNDVHCRGMMNGR